MFASLVSHVNFGQFTIDGLKIFFVQYSFQILGFKEK